MKHPEKSLQDIARIRSLMEESTRFMSLSGLSGVGAGTTALVGAYVAWQYLVGEGLYGNFVSSTPFAQLSLAQMANLLGIAAVLLLMAGGTAYYFSARLAQQRGLPFWNKAARRLLVHFAVPLVAGAVFSVLLLVQGFGVMVPATTLIFYGLALLNAGKYTLREVQLLGLGEIGLGLLAACFIGHGLLAWAVGFGVLHIAYGLVLYHKYERT